MESVRQFLATPVGKFVSRYILILVVGFTLLALRPVNDHFVDPYTTLVAHEARVVLNLLGEGASVHGKILSSPRFSVAIYNGCNGLEAKLIFLCGVLAFPVPWKQRAIGLLLGILAIQLVNIIRVVSLFYIGIYAPSWFSISHVFIWQTLIILTGVLLWLLWVYRYALTTTTRPAS